MADWTKQQPSGSASRRKWKLDDRATLNNLKYQIASDGFPDVQYNLAKELLDAEVEQDVANPNLQQAVHWLICAVEQGHEPAASLLHECYNRNCGITPENESEVRCCLSMTPGERAARKAARELFACLSNGNEYITPKKLEHKMRKIYNIQKRRRRHHDPSTSTSEEDSEDETAMKIGEPNGRQYSQSLHANLKLDSQSASGPERVITEENLVSAAVNYAAGRLPAVNDALIYSVPHPDSLDHVPCFHRLLLHPAVFCTILYHRLINFISALPTTVPPSMRLALLFLTYWLASSENLTIIIPIGFYYLSLAVMIWSTCKMLKAKQDFIDFRIWSGLFLRYGDHNIEADLSENRFLKNNMKPYLWFFCAFVGSLVIYPLIANQNDWLPHSELTIISCLFAFISLVVFMYSSPFSFPDWVILTSFGVNVLAKYPYEMDEVVTTGWRFLDLKFPTFSSFVIGNGIEFCLNCRTALYLLIPGFLVHLAKRSNWHGTYIYLIPHCVTLSWLQLCIITAQSGVTMLGVLRGALGLAGILLFLPLFGIVSLLIPVFVAIDWMGFTDPSIRWCSTLILGTVALVGSCFLALNHITRRYVTILQVFLCIIAASVLTFPYMTSLNSFKDEAKTLYKPIPTVEHHNTAADNFLNWQMFYEICGEPAWDGHQNKIFTQLRCSHLEGTKVSWEGSVSKVQISSVSNIRAVYINKYLPHWLSQFITCIYGERIKESPHCNSKSDELCYEELQYIVKNNQLDMKCHLNKWNIYEYEIHVKMFAGLLSKSEIVVLQANNKFGNFTRRLAVGDHLFFRGALQNSRIHPNGYRQDYILGSAFPNVKLMAVKCIHCRDKNQIPVVAVEKESAVDARLRDLKRGIKYLLNVLLNPLITFK